MMRPTFPTPYIRANTLAGVLHDGALAALGQSFVGMLLLGSLATGDYDPSSSDLDFLIVTADPVGDAQFEALRRMHAALRTHGMPGMDNVEGAYIPRANLRVYQPADVHPWLGSDGHFAWETQNSDWIIQRHIARECGVIVSGPDPRELINPVSTAELKSAAAGLLREWWAWQIDDHRNLLNDEYQAYAVLTMCRARYTLATGGIASKPAAARWLMAQEPRFASLIDRALAWRLGTPMNALRETVDLLAVVIGESRE